MIFILQERIIKDDILSVNINTNFILKQVLLNVNNSILYFYLQNIKSIFHV